MNWRNWLLVFAIAAVGFLQATHAVLAEDAKPATSAPAATTEKKDESPANKPSSAPKLPPYAEVIKDHETIDGLIKLHRKGNRLLGELTSAHMNRDFIVLISIAKGIGRGSLLGGMSWGFGDDWIWQFRKADDRIHVVRRNVRFTAKKGDPQERAVGLAFTDSVLFSLPIIADAPGGHVVDLTSIFMGDLPQISTVLPGFTFAENRSTWATGFPKGFPNNIELEVAATYASSGRMDIDSLADSRGATIHVHYSISALPESGYKPRLADDRVGYFLTVVKDWSYKGDDDRFVRYINRWDLQKADPSAAQSPPMKPVTFWLEKTIPYAYRKPIREGIEEWNKGFEKAGFLNAIEVRQQQDKDEWDPEDIRYNTFRWITAAAGFAMGPSRVNPSTGQILDADIIFDADFLQFWKQDYESFTAESVAAVTGGPLDLKSYQEHLRKHGPHDALHCQLQNGLNRQFALGATLLGSPSAKPADLERLIMQGLKWATMHEVGHTLGLRHNFKASTMLSMGEINDVQKTRDVGLIASVMDYHPANLMPKSATQGDYFSTTIGPYDSWAIEYGYKPLSGGTEGEVAELKKIAARGAEPGLAYATDEDTMGIAPDPLSNAYDMSNDPIAYAKLRAQFIAEQWPKIVEETTKDGEGYQRARRAMGVLLESHGEAMYFVSRFVGGMYTSRAHKGDPNAQPPLVVVDAKKQREALDVLEEQIFSSKPFELSPTLYGYLASSRWSHWGAQMSLRSDFPVHDVIGMWQGRVLDKLLSPLTLDRLHDAELHVAADQDALTTAELLERLTHSIFSEVESVPSGEFSTRKPAIDSLRRNLQRDYLKRLSNVALGITGAPQDCQTVAFMELKGLEGRINDALAKNTKLDAYSKAHLEESASRIHKVIDSRLTFQNP
ncbi:MAG: zinc-dependent metalloprotease [Pirellulales bacterium]